MEQKKIKILFPFPNLHSQPIKTIEFSHTEPSFFIHNSSRLLKVYEGGGV